jgi:cobaltochelatase CobT
MPARTLPAQAVAEARGFADGARLRLRHHDVAMHGRQAPADAVARAVFDAVEQARVEAIGSRSMAGVRQNLTQAFELRMRSDPIARARARDEVPLATAVGLIVRERLTGEAPPRARCPASISCASGSRPRPAPISTRSRCCSTTSRVSRA